MSRFVLDIPDAEKEKEKCQSFLQDFHVDGDFKYMDMLVRVRLHLSPCC